MTTNNTKGEKVKTNTKRQQYRDYLAYYGLKSHEFTFSDWAAMVQVESFYATR